MHHHTLSEVLVEENVETAEAAIIKWDDTEYLSRIEANEYVKSVKDLQSAMHFYVSANDSRKLINAQNLMQMAMKRLEKELYHILSTNSAELKPESIISGESEAMSEIRLIAECMISAGYGKECVKIYKIIRKSAVDEALYRLGIEPVTQNQVDKWNWDVADLKIKNWVAAIKVAVTTVFAGERILCDFVFSNYDSISESCFNETTQNGANILFNFPQLITKGKRSISTSSENIFRTLDLYVSISQLLPDIESVFSFASTASIRSQAASSLVTLRDAVRLMLTEFESAIQKDSSRKVVPGGGIHPLTRYVMNYICYLSDYTETVGEQIQELLSADQFSWLILVLLCKLDSKTQAYKDISLSYLFLANNLHYIISKVRSSNLVLGEEWIPTHQLKLIQYTSNYQKMAWSKVLSTLPTDPMAQISRQQAIHHFQRFSSAFKAVYQTQYAWVVPDRQLRNQIKTSVSQTLLPPYQQFYVNYRLLVEQVSAVKFTPDDLQNNITDLFSGSDSSSRAKLSSQ